MARAKSTQKHPPHPCVVVYGTPTPRLINHEESTSQKEFVGGTFNFFSFQLGSGWVGCRSVGGWI